MRILSRSGEFWPDEGLLDPTELVEQGQSGPGAEIRHHVYAKTSHKDVQLAEVGPRFEAKRE